jgi:hypothetical protein
MKHEERKIKFIKDFYQKFPDFTIVKFTKMSEEVIVRDNDGFEYKKNNCFNVLKSSFNIQSVIDKKTYIEKIIKILHPNLKLIQYNGMNERLLVEDENGFKYNPNCYDLLNGSKVSIETCLEKECLFKFKANKRHNDFYKYPNFNYTNGKQKIKIECKIHGVFEQICESHLFGHGCKKCATIGFSKQTWLNRLKGQDAYFYMLRIFSDNEEFIKIGITSNTIEQRYKNLKNYRFEIIKLLKDTPSKVYDMEKQILKKYKTFKYFPKKEFEGWSECFVINCLGEIIID